MTKGLPIRVLVLAILCGALPARGQEEIQIDGISDDTPVPMASAAGPRGARCNPGLIQLPPRRPGEGRPEPAWVAAQFAKLRALERRVPGSLCYPPASVAAPQNQLQWLASLDAVYPVRAWFPPAPIEVRHPALLPAARTGPGGELAYARVQLHETGRKVVANLHGELTLDALSRFVDEFAVCGYIGRGFNQGLELKRRTLATTAAGPVVTLTGLYSVSQCTPGSGSVSIATYEFAPDRAAGQLCCTITHADGGGRFDAASVDCAAAPAAPLTPAELEQATRLYAAGQKRYEEDAERDARLRAEAWKRADEELAARRVAFWKKQDEDERLKREKDRRKFDEEEIARRVAIQRREALAAAERALATARQAARLAPAKPSIASVAPLPPPRPEAERPRPGLLALGLLGLAVGVVLAVSTRRPRGK